MDSGYSALEFEPYTHIKDRERSINFNINLYTILSSGLQSSTQPVSSGLTSLTIPDCKKCVDSTPKQKSIQPSSSSTVLEPRMFNRSNANNI